jgi:hypothetical protein
MRMSAGRLRSRGCRPSRDAMADFTLRRRDACPRDRRRPACNERPSRGQRLSCGARAFRAPTSATCQHAEQCGPGGRPRSTDRTNSLAGVREAGSSTAFARERGFRSSGSASFATTVARRLGRPLTRGSGARGPLARTEAKALPGQNLTARFFRGVGATSCCMSIAGRDRK